METAVVDTVTESEIKLNSKIIIQIITFIPNFKHKEFDGDRGYKNKT